MREPEIIDLRHRASRRTKRLTVRESVKFSDRATTKKFRWIFGGDRSANVFPARDHTLPPAERRLLDAEPLPHGGGKCRQILQVVLEDVAHHGFVDARVAVDENVAKSNRST